MKTYYFKEDLGGGKFAYCTMYYYDAAVDPTKQAEVDIFMTMMTVTHGYIEITQSEFNSNVTLAEG